MNSVGLILQTRYVHTACSQYVMRPLPSLAQPSFPQSVSGDQVTRRLAMEARPRLRSTSTRRCPLDAIAAFTTHDAKVALGVIGVLFLIPNRNELLFRTSTLVRD